MNQRDVSAVFAILIILIWVNSYVARSSTNEFECHWKKYSSTINVSCRLLSNLSIVKDLLSELSNYTIYQMLFSNCLFTNIPSDVFKNVSIVKMIINSPLNAIADDALENIEKLTELKMFRTNFSRVPTAVKVLYEVKTLKIELGHLQQLDDLQNMSSLITLNLKKNSISELAKDAFLHTPVLTYIDLSKNYLKTIHPDTLDPLQLLKFINLAHNHFSSVDGAFKNINPEKIFLSYNKLTSVENVLHSNMMKLRFLDIGSNPIKFVNSATFRDKTNQLEKIVMNNLMIDSVPADLFKPFEILNKVDLSYNNLTYLPETLFQSIPSLQEAILTSNRLTSVEGLFKFNKQLMRLDLSKNKIVKIGDSFQNTPKLQYLIIFRNEIKHFGSREFNNLQNLKQLRASNNNISRIHSSSFRYLKSLRILDLSHNAIEKLNGSVSGKATLDQLIVQNCRLNYLSKSEFSGLSTLETLTMTGNRLRSVEGAFSDLINLKFLHLNKNKLTTLTKNSFPEKPKIKKIWLTGNRWKCDCRLLWFKKWMLKINYTIFEDEPTCFLPYRLREKTLRTVTLEDLTVWPEECPDPCQCSCRPNGSLFYVSVNCSDRKLHDIPQTLPKHLGELNLKNNFLRNLTNVNYELLRKIEIMNFENNNISEINLTIPSTLRVLLLAGNNMTHFPTYLFANRSLKVITLSRNPWICDCSTRTFRVWLLSEKTNIKDVNETRCGFKGEQNSNLFGKVITSLTDNQLCPSTVSLYVSIAMGTLGLLLVATSLVLLHSRYRLHIKVWLYAHGVTWVKEEDLDTDKRFDALVSYSQPDQSFVVTELIPKLEKQQPFFSLCIPERDILAGGFALNDRLTAVSVSKRVIVVLSQNFLQDELCMEEFRTAFAISLEDKVHRIIMVKYGKLESVEDMDKALKTHLDSIRCLKWGEKLFWEKMRYAMPKKLKRTVNVETSVNRRNPETQTLLAAGEAPN